MDFLQEIIIINNNLFTYSACVPWKDAHKRITKMNLLQNLQS